MNTPKPPRPKRVRLRIPEGGTVIFDFEEQAAIWLRSGYPQVAIDRLRNGASIESAELRAAIADFMEGKIKRKPGRPLRDPIEEGIREADALKAELVRSTVLVREQEMAKLRREQPKLRRKLTGGAVPKPAEIANKAAAEAIGRNPNTYTRDRHRKSDKK